MNVALNNKKRKMEKLQYITSLSKNETTPQIVETVCKSGIKWVQFRQKNVNPVKFEKEAIKIKNICKKYNSLFIVNDNVEIAKKIQADGVHLGKNDMLPDEARKILGNDKIIGGTANTFDDIQKLVKLGVNYIGLGPFRFTKTKKNLSPILGIEGYKKIIKQCKQNKINIPIFAIGGITPNDVKSIINTGIHGIAVSSVISNSENINKTITMIKQDLFD